MWKKYKPYILSSAVALAVGGLSALLTKDNMDLTKDYIMPPLSPPGVVFPIVWSILYILMGIASALVYLNKSKNPDGAKNALTVYAASLIFNFFWSIIFFNLHAFLASFVWLLILWALILICIIKFKPFSKAASCLMIPYLLWVSFAGYLNLAIYILNR